MSSISICNSEFGIVIVRYDARARRIIFRVKNGELHITVPLATPRKIIESSIENKRTEIKELFIKNKAKILNIGDVIQTRCFTIRLHSHSLSKILFSLKGEEFNVFIPQEVDVECLEFQKLLKQKILRVAKRVAEPYLYNRLNELAQKNGLTFNEFAVSTARTRMGVCNIKRKITLSAYLIFYPQHLVDYVILHELAHLTEMNHGPRFHSLCNEYCGGRERELEREFKQFKNPL